MKRLQLTRNHVRIWLELRISHLLIICYHSTSRPWALYSYSALSIMRMLWPTLLCLPIEDESMLSYSKYCPGFSFSIYDYGCTKHMVYEYDRSGWRWLRRNSYLALKSLSYHHHFKKISIICIKIIRFNYNPFDEQWLRTYCPRMANSKKQWKMNEKIYENSINNNNDSTIWTNK